MAQVEGKERRMAKIEKCLAEYGFASLEEARDLCLSKGIDVDAIVKGVQPIEMCIRDSFTLEDTKRVLTELFA